MELMYPVVVLIGVIVLLILCLLPLKPKKGFTEGKKVISPTSGEEEAYYKKKLKIYKVFALLTKIACGVGIVASLIMVARPYVTEVRAKEDYKRDIMLCIDISYSVDDLNQKLMRELKDMVKDLSGERFGIVIYNCTPVQLVPLTDDYDYIISVLDELEEDLKARDGFAVFNTMDGAQSAYISAGTEGENGDRGSSLVPDGLATAIFDFPKLDEDQDRTRIIIMSTDNEQNGESLLTLDEAATICKKKKIVVYGIGTKGMDKRDKEEMQNAVVKTGGRFFLQEDSGTMREIVEAIDKSGKSLIKSGTEMIQVDDMRWALALLLISVAGMFGLSKWVRL